MPQPPSLPPDDPLSEQEFFGQETQASTPRLDNETETVCPPNKEAASVGGRRLEIGDVFELPEGDSRPIQSAAESHETPSQPSHLRTPEPAMLGQYEIISEIGRGGMGVVYKGLQRRLGRHVGLKVLPEHLASNVDLVARFEVEARAAARLNHPNIAAIYEIGQHEGTHFFAMEFIEGDTLSHLVHEQGKLTSQDAVSYIAQAADALAYAHKKNVIHRDLKPSNIMLTESGHIKLMDFGLARLQDEDNRLTMSGMTLGTPAYMSPEQAGSERYGVLDHRADIYSLGVVLYELVTGRLPFDGRSKLDIMRKIIDEEAPHPSVHRPDLSSDLERVILKAMAKQVESRYATADAMRDDLRRISDESSTNTMPSMQSAGAAMPGSPLANAEARRKSRPFKIAAAVAAIVIVAIVALSVRQGKKQPGDRSAVAGKRDPGAALSEIESLLDAGNPIEARSELRRAAARVREAGDAELSREFLTLQSRANGEIFKQATEAYASNDFARAFALGFASSLPLADGQQEKLRAFVKAVAPDSAETFRTQLLAQDGDGIAEKFLELTVPGLAQKDLEPLGLFDDVELGTANQSSLIRRAYLGALAVKTIDLGRTDLAASGLIALLESAESEDEFARFFQATAKFVVERKWTGAKLAAQALPARPNIPAQRGARPIQQRLIPLLPKLLDSAAQGRSEELRESARNLWNAESEATLNRILSSLPLEELHPTSSPANRFERREDAIVSATRELRDKTLPGVTAARWPLANTNRRPPPGILPNSQLPDWYATTIEIGDGNDSSRRAAVQTDGSDFLLFLDTNSDGELSDEVPYFSRFDQQLIIPVSGRFSVSTLQAYSFEFEEEPSPTLLARHLTARGGEVALGKTRLTYAIVDRDSDGLFDDFADAGAGGRLGIGGSWLSLVPDLPFEVDGGLYKLTDLTSLASTSYWESIGAADHQFQITLGQTPPELKESAAEPPTRGRVYSLIGNAIRSYEVQLGPWAPIALPDGLIDLYILAPGYIPIRATQAADTILPKIAQVLQPYDASGTQHESKEFSNDELRRGVALALLPHQGPTAAEAGRSVREIELRRGPAGALEIGILIPYTKLLLGSDTLSGTGTFVLPTLVEYVAPPLEKPLVLRPLDGRLGYELDLHLADLGEEGCRLIWQRRMTDLPPVDAP